MAFLYPTTISTWTTKKPGNRLRAAYGHVYLLNTNRIVDMIELLPSKVQFLFANDPDDPRDSPDTITCSNSVATWRTGHDTVQTSKFASLDLFPENNTSGTPVTTLIEWDDIAYVWATARDYADDVCRIVYYKNDWKRQEAVVNMSILAFLILQTA